MKEKLIVALIALIISLLLFGCATTTSTGRSLEEAQQEYYQESAYFFKTDGPKYIDYVEKDSNATAREKLTAKRRLHNIYDLIDLMNVQE